VGLVKIAVGHPVILRDELLVHLPADAREWRSGPGYRIVKNATLAERFSADEFWPAEWATLCGLDGMTYQYNGSARATGRHFCLVCLERAPVDRSGVLDLSWGTERGSVEGAVGGSPGGAGPLAASPSALEAA
jgi:hypothetical protein